MEEFFTMIYMILADGFEDIEALTPLDILRRAKIPVKTAALCGNSATSAHNVNVQSDISIDEINTSDMDMLVLPGGAGHVHLDASEKVHSLIDYALKNDIYLAAICASPSILGKRGIFDGKSYTCFPCFQQHCTGGIYSDAKVVLDGKILTGKGAGAASDFGFKIVEIFKSKELASGLKKQMQF